MNAPDFDRARAYALERLERELPRNLFYHSLVHTRNEVVPAVQRLAALEGVEGGLLLLLLTAACYHDIGFLRSRQDHELASVSIAQEVLPTFGYRPAQIRIIDQTILSTAASETPHTLLEMILVDADFDILGTEAYQCRSDDLRRQLAAFGTTSSDEEWCRTQVDLLETHRYRTRAAHRLRDPGRQRNLELARGLLTACREHMAPSPCRSRMVPSPCRSRMMPSPCRSRMVPSPCRKRMVPCTCRRRR